MIIPTLRIQVWKQYGTDLQGQPRTRRIADEKVSPVKLEFDTQHTTVRTDSSASHGHAEEGTANVVLLAVPATKIAVNDILVVRGRKVRVFQTHERFTVFGKKDHIEVRCVAWA